MLKLNMKENKPLSCEVLRNDILLLSTHVTFHLELCERSVTASFLFFLFFLAKNIILAGVKVCEVVLFFGEWEGKWQHHEAS